MGFEKIKLEYQYRSDKHDVYKDFYEKCIAESIKYDRAVGYFTSGSLKLMAQGLEKFIFNEGKIRIVTSPKFSKEDIKALNNGKELKNLLNEKLLFEWQEFSKSIQENTIEVFSWLVATERIEIKIAYPKELTGIYHEKFGIFEDKSGDLISFSGSVNETIGGMKNNFEAIDVFSSQFGKTDMIRIKEKQNNFENLWENRTKKIEIISIPEALKEKILETTPESIEILKRKLIQEKEDNKIEMLRKPEYLKLRSYQEDAFNAWKNNNGNGILEMATGTGKTITALNIMTELSKLALKSKNQIFFVVLCPDKFLSYQWSKECKGFGMTSTICNSDNQKWKKEFKKKKDYYEAGIIKTFISIVTKNTFRNDTFQNLIKDMVAKNMMLIVDECHNIGSELFQKLLEKEYLGRIKYKLGLSATPKRFMDEEGNQAIANFLGKIIFTFTMEEAIENNFLTSYEYKIHFIKLTEKEEEEYLKLTKQIIKCFNYKTKKESQGVSLLLFKRSRIIYNAKNKTDKLIKLLKEMKEIKKSLIYVGAGKVEKKKKFIKEDDEKKSIEFIKEKIQENFKVNIKKFTSEESSDERKVIINEFNAGYLDIILGIKCLDEGVNIPSIETAYIMASTTNPKEYIQRRGRVLRKYKNKEKAIIHDFIVIPRSYNLNKRKISYEKFERSLLEKELSRVKEFARLAENYLEIVEKTKEIQKIYKLHML